MRTAGYRSRTGRSAMLAGRPVLGRTGRCGLGLVTTAMSWLPVISWESWLSGSFLISQPARNSKERTPRFG